VELLEQSLGIKPLIDRQPPQPGDVPLTFANVDKARRMLGYNPSTTMEAGLAKFAEWFLGREKLRVES
jgi:UDP-glucuronate 4-epimerase